MKKEVWKSLDFIGCPNYEVSNLGNIRSIISNRIRKPNIACGGYHIIRFTTPGKTFLVHRLVAMAFIPNPNNLPEVNHKDENNQNNLVENLEWCSSKYNANYGHRNVKRSKTTYQYDLNGNLINIFPSANKAAKELGFEVTAICSCCKGRTKTSYGYIWSYENKQ